MEYAIYKGDEFLFMGAEDEVLNKFGWNRNTLMWMCSNQAVKRLEESERGRIVGVPLNPLFNIEEKYEFDIEDDSTKYKIYCYRVDNPELSNKEIGDKLGLHITTVQSHLRSLRSEGYDV